MNHINKDSRPDLLERINVKVEPGGGRTALNQNVADTVKKMRELARIWTQVDEGNDGTSHVPKKQRKSSIVL